MRRSVLLGIALAVVLLAGLGWLLARRAPVGQSAALTVATSITPLADLIRNVGGERVTVLVLVPAGADPEDFDPTPPDVAALGRARVFFANGLGLEAYLQRVVAAAGNQLEVVTLSEGLPALRGFGQGAEAGGNPHLWLNPRYAMHYVEVIRQTLDRIDPDGAALYDANAERYLQQLAELDAEIERLVATLPPSARVLVSTHDVYPYFAERYGFRYLAVLSVRPGADPSAREYAELVRVVRENGVKAVFGEAGFSDRFIAQLAADTGARYIADLYTDTLGREPPVDTYIGAMRYNAQAIVEGLR